MQLQRLLSYTRKAVDEYSMIQEGDHIAVGISGGKDSLTLLYALHGLKRFYPRKFDLSAVTVDLGFADFNLEPIQNLCRELEVPYKIVKSDIYDILFNVRQESNPCSLCAKMRKGALNEAVKEMGCNKVAYAHHKDDIIETMLLSLIFEGRFYSFSPKTYLDRMDLTVIRPMMFIDEMEVIGFRNKYSLPVVKGKCPVDGHTKRQYAKELLREIGLEEFANEYPANLSGGEIRRVSIVRAMINNPKVILADEPTSNLDPENSHKVMQMLRDISKSGTTVILSTHELEYLSYVNRVFKMDCGTLK